ncbi:hypothetical protein Goarm_012258 [Gossypium armourianum]|uniref:Uncharacterized protein n=1 Tax=Gossypium armourianum TaxID=34283 RepID=A0A7J9IZD5_9ROSI|nr:hypothetical protein [Gossypium armourianum]MBA0827479.1 hypothetical protein [Gossypium armourianum]
MNIRKILGSLGEMHKLIALNLGRI